MSNDLKPARYSGVAQLLHWVSAALIVAQYALAWSAEDLPLGMHKLALLARHTAILHLLAALKHHFWDKDDVLLRMLPRRSSRERSGGDAPG